MPENKFPNPEGKINVLKRYLHILALLQYIPENNETWNAGSLADLLSKDETRDAGIQDSSVTKYINNQLVKELEIVVDKSRGLHVISIAEDLEVETQLKIASVYAGFVIKDRSRDIALKSFIEAMPGRALWLLARVYFAVIENRMLQINYTGSNGRERKEWKLFPCYFFLSDFRLYLAAYDPAEDLRFTLLAERIENLIVSEKANVRNFKISPVEQLYRNSLSAFLSPAGPVQMKIRYKKFISSDIKNILNPLITKSFYSVDDTWDEADFIIDDYGYLCKQLFMYGSNVVILSPPHVRETMIDMLKKSMSMYE